MSVDYLAAKQTEQKIKQLKAAHDEYVAYIETGARILASFEGYQFKYARR